MNKFSDGFSDKNFDDLLNEYAGSALGNKPSRTEPPKRVQKPASQKKAEPMKKPEFNIDISRKNTIKQDDFELIKPFEEEFPQEPVKKSDTMEFKKQRRNRPVIEKRNDFKKPSFNARINSIKNSAQKKLYTDETSPKAQQEKGEKGKFSAEMLVRFFMKHKKSFISLGICLVISLVLSTMIISCINDVLGINRGDEKIVEVTLPNDAKTFDAVRALDKAGLIKNSIFCNLFLNVMGYTDENYLPGIYYFTADMGVEKMVTRFKTSVQRGKIISITIPEGYTIDQVFERLEKNDICSSSSLYKVIQDVDFSAEYDFVAKIDNKEARYHALEGYIYPATYEFEQGATPGAVIRKFLDTFESRWTEEYAAKAKALGKTTDEIIKIASIIEKEGANKDQFKLVSSVLHNRLNRSGLYPTLDCDSTKDYVTNTISKRITSPSQINAYILSYSTYEKAGLPVGAICNPGAAAIEAALNPSSTQYYFFAHDNNKKIYMAATLEEHNSNKRIIQNVNSQDD